MLRKYALVAAISVSVCVVAQTDGLGKFVSGGVQDAATLYTAYLTPYFNAMGAGLSGGWYNTAKPHKPLGFDLTLTTSVGIVPAADRSFDINALMLNQLSPDGAGSNTTPTVAGKNESGANLVYQTELGDLPAFAMPKGTGNPYVPVPMLQLGLGIYKGTEVMGRFMPTLKTAGFSTNLWGVGLKHNIDQWIPVIKRVPVFNFSVMGGYTVLHSDAEVSVTPNDVGAEDQTGGASWDNQTVEMEIRNFTANLLLSFNFPVVCLYGGAGISSTTSSLRALGNYPVPVYNGSDMEMVVASPTVNPIDISIKHNDGNATKPRYNAGIRFKMAVITLHVDYTYAYYNVITAGLGVSIR